MKKFFTALWARWKKIALVMGVFQTRLVLTLLYYTLLLPFGLLARVFLDSLGLKHRAGQTAWQERSTRDKTLEDLRRQF